MRIRSRNFIKWILDSSFETADQERWSLDVKWKLFSVRDFRRIRVDSASIDK